MSDEPMKFFEGCDDESHRLPSGAHCMNNPKLRGFRHPEMTREEYEIVQRVLAEHEAKP